MNIRFINASVQLRPAEAFFVVIGSAWNQHLGCRLSQAADDAVPPGEWLMYRDILAMIVAGVVGLIPATIAVLTLKRDVPATQQAHENVSQIVRPG